MNNTHKKSHTEACRAEHLNTHTAVGSDPADVNMFSVAKYEKTEMGDVTFSTLLHIL